jgi:hypothetical protein
LHAVNVRTNHVHVVVTAPGYSPDEVYEQLKAWCTRKLKASCGNRKKFWTERASKECINDDDELEQVVAYVTDAQDRKHLDELANRGDKQSQ